MLSNLLSDTGCPVCRDPSTSLAFVKNGYPMHRCASCDLVFSSQPPVGDDLEELYSAEYFTNGGAGYPDYIADERVHRRQARTYLRKITKVRPSPGALLDIGCAAGFFLDEARAAGWAVQGCELSPYAQAHAHEKLGLDVARAGFLDSHFAPASGAFDVVTLFNVLEHIPEPTRVADKLHAIIRPGGNVVVESWDTKSWLARLLGARWPTYAPPTVLYCFARRTLERLFEPSRWTLVSYRPSIKWISVDHGLSLLEYEAEQLPAAHLLRPLLGAARRSFLGRLDVPYCLGDLATAVFRREPSRAVHSRWNGAPRTNSGPTMSSGLSA